jgi:hypothetical protein
MRFLIDADLPKSLKDIFEKHAADLWRRADLHKGRGGRAGGSTAGTQHFSF